ncbi:MAG: hypothetical protein U5J62_00410 [Desulfurivibrio sp.]|nr:hypothetical protein [Desulfurivibrio sp.]
MAPPGADEQRTAFLARIGREAADWSLRPLLLPGGLVLLAAELSAAEQQRFLLLLGSRLNSAGDQPAGLAGEDGRAAAEVGAADDGTAKRQDHDHPSHGRADSCQVTVEERRQLFGDLQWEQ